MSILKDYISIGAKPFLNLIYPPSCVHCGEGLFDSSGILCEACKEHLSPIEPLSRCRYCYSELQEANRTVCSQCRRKRFSFSSCAAVWEFIGPPHTLIQKLKNGSHPFFGKIIAAYLVAHWHRLEWPMPDFVIPVPSPWTILFKGNDAAACIAESAAQMLGCPCIYPLRRKSGSFSQSKVPLERRIALDPSEFRLTNGETLFDKTILLIDDYFATGTTFKCCSEILSEAFPKSIYALAACCDIH